MATALITGATAGIGASYANLLAKEGFDLILVARDLPRLNQVAKELTKRFGVKTQCIKADLTKPSQLAKVEKRVADLKKPIDVLVNNAGFGIKDGFTVSNLDKEQELLDVLVTAPMRLTHAVLPVMVKRNTGIIVNVSSVASFIAGGTYSAAKSYLTVFSESLHTPGFTRTEFHSRGRMKMTALPKFMWLDSDKLVSKSWKHANANRAISIPGWQYKILSAIARNAPRPIVRKVGMNVRKKQR